MKESDNWNQEGVYPPPPGPEAANAGEAARQHWPPGYGAPHPYPERLSERRKKKWVAGLLAFFIPGTGHMYLGLMVKGVVLMMLLFLDITALIQAGLNGNTLSIALLAFLIPIIYFYSLFDAIQRTDAINDRTGTKAQGPGYRAGWAPTPAPSPSPAYPPYPEQRHAEQAPYAEAPPSTPPQAPRPQTEYGVPPVGIMIVAGAGVLMLLMSGSGWTNRIFSSAGSVFGAIVLIGAGVFFWFWENRGHKKTDRS
ncbi:hypothetical protein [Cohnella cellulosilytica]|uniref:TM2 domain-containing protein n=1 Tax=Cohnella cellulosilytica TaxID=986710 RepID=A0ABW2F743_9BACL